LSVKQIAMVGQQPLNSVRRAAFFVGRESENQIPLRNPAFALQANETGHKKSIAVFYVAGAAAVEIAVHFVELEGIKVGGPILFERLHDVEMGDEQNRLRAAVPASPIADHKIVLIRQRAKNVDVFCGEAC